MGEINERRGIGSSGHRNPTNVTLGPESLGSVWDLQPPAGACKFTGHRPANIKGGSLPVNSHSIVFPDARAKRRSTAAPISLPVLIT